MRKYAILLSGGIGYEYNYERYRNDLNLAHNVLKKIAGFSDENIFLFYGDGMGYFADAGIAPQAAEKMKLLNCLKELQHELGEDDEFVFCGK